MLAVYRSEGRLGEAHLALVEHAATRAIAADEFAQYRTGPMCQCFADMLALAEKTPDLTALEPALAPSGRLWKSFRLKAQRFSAEAPHIQTAPTPITHHLH